MKEMKYTAPLLMFLAACIWGAAFVAQSEATQYIGPFTFNSARFLLGSLVLLPLIWIGGRSKKKDTDTEGIQTGIDQKKDKKNNWIAGVICGVVLTFASFFQQYGIGFTTVGKAGFITALYIIIVPFLGLLFGRRISKVLMLSLLVALTGLYLLCMKTSDLEMINYGDLMLMICAVLFSAHILVIGHFAPGTDGVKVSCIQFFTGFLLSGIGAILFETIQMEAILQAYAPILYAGIFSCGVAYTLQIMAQKKIDPSLASLIGSLESVTAAVAGWLILGQTMTLRESVGSLLVFLAIIMAQLPERKVQETNEISFSVRNFEK